MVIPENALAGMYPDTVIDAGNPVNAFDPIDVILDEFIEIIFKAEQP